MGPSRHCGKCLAAAIAALGIGAVVNAARGDVKAVSWRGVSGAWETPSAWTGGVTPANTASTQYDVYIDGGDAINSTVRVGMGGFGSVYNINTLTVSAGDRLEYFYLDFGGPQATINLAGSATIDGTVQFGGGGGTLSVGANQQLTGTGTINGGGGASYAYIRASSGTLTIGSGLKLNGNFFFGDAVQPLVTAGTLRATSGSNLNVSGSTIVNSGTLISDVGGAVNINTTFRYGELGTIVNNGHIRIDGTLDNVGRTFRVDNASGDWWLGGTLLGGTYESADGRALRVDFPKQGTLDNVIVNGEIQVTGGSALHIASGQSLHGSGTISLGVGTFGSGYVSSIDTGLSIDAGMTVHGYGAVGGPSNEPAGPIVNRGRISADVSGRVLDLRATTIQNLGVIESKNGGILGIGGTFKLDGLGTVINNSKFRITGTLDNAGRTFTVNNSSGAWELAGTIRGGTIETQNGLSLVIPNSPPTVATLDDVRVNGLIQGGQVNIPSGQSLLGSGTISSNVYADRGNATLNIGPDMHLIGTGVIGSNAAPVVNAGLIYSAVAAPSRITIAASHIENNGVIEVAAGSALSIRAPFTIADLGTLHNAGTIYIDGALDNTGRVFHPGVTVPGNWVLSSNTSRTGGIRGGQVISPVGQTFHLNGFAALLDGVTLSGSFDLVGGCSLDIRGALAGNAQIALLTNFGGQTITASNGTLIIGSGITIRGGRVGAGSITLGNANDTQHVDRIVNEGQVIADGVVPGSGVSTALPMKVTTTNFENNGLLSTTRSGAIDVRAATFANSGTVSIGADTHFRVPRDTIDGYSGDITVLDGGALSIDLGSTNTQSSSYLIGGLEVFGTLDLSSADDYLTLVPVTGFSASRDYLVATYRLGLVGTFDHVTPGFVVDYSIAGKVIVRAVPEPSAPTLLGASLAAFTACRRRRRESLTSRSCRS